MTAAQNTYETAYSRHRAAAAGRRWQDSGMAPAPREIRLQVAASRPTAVIARRTTWAEFPALWRPLLDEVYAVLARNGEPTPGGNVMVYLDDVPHVEVGVEVAAPFAPSGPVICSALPAGPVATAVHRGPYEQLAATHAAVRAWCAAQGRALAGPRWEVYGDWREDPAELETTVSYLIRPA
jgi:effector-binding domain-containing protein